MEVSWSQAPTSYGFSMSRSKRIDAHKAAIANGILELNTPSPGIVKHSPYGMSRVNYYKLQIIEEKLDDLSERLQLIETALGLLASKKAS